MRRDDEAHASTNGAEFGAPRTLELQSVYRVAQTEDGGLLSLREILDVLGRYLWLIVLTGGLGLAATIWWLASESPLYQASALIRLTEPSQELGTDTRDPQPAGVRSDPLLSEIMVLQGRGVAGAVVDEMGLRLIDIGSGFPPAYVSDAKVSLAPLDAVTVELVFGPRSWTVSRGGATGQATYGRAAGAGGVSMVVGRPPETARAQLVVVTRDAAIDMLLSRVAARPRQGTDGIDVSFVAPEPRGVVEVVNAVVEAYREVNANTAQQLAKRRRMFLEGRLREIDSLLIEAQAALSVFRSRQQLYNSSEQISAQQRAILDLDLRRNELDADRRTYVALVDGLERARASGEDGDLASLVSPPGISSNPIVSQLYSQLTVYRATRDSTTSGPWAKAGTHPDVERLTELIDSTESQLIAAVRSYLTSLDERITQLADLRGRSAAEMGRLPDAEAEEVRLVQQVESLRTVGDGLRTEYQLARMDEAVEAGQVEIVNLATRAAPVPGRRGLKLFLGAMIGLMFGGAFAFTRDHLNDTLVRKEEVETALRVPSLATIPRLLPPPRRGRARRLRPSSRTRRGRANGKRANGSAASTHGRGGSTANGDAGPVDEERQPRSEAYRTLRTNLLFSRSPEVLQSIVVTSTGPEEGKTVTVVNLGLAFAQQGVRLLLIDSDLRKPRLAQHFDLPRSPGLTEVLTGEVHIRKAVRRTGIPGLHVLPSGTTPPNPSELLGGRRMERLLSGLVEGYDIVLLDSPPVLAAPDAAVLGALADGVLMVVRAGETDRAAAEYARQQLERVGAHVVGAVLNDPDRRVPRYGSYELHQYYAEREGV